MKTHTDISAFFTGMEWHRNLFSLQNDLSREFIVDGCTYGQIYNLAAEIRHLQAPSGKSRAMLCLCTDDKALIAAAVVASLSGGPQIICPYAFSRQAVEEALEVLPFSYILTERPGDFPSGPEVIIPSISNHKSAMPDAFIDADDTFLMLFTGGSTGKPKVWSKTPRNLFAEALYLSKLFAISPNDLVLSTVPPRHIYGLLHSVLIPFICSARILGGVYTFPREILRTAQDYRATILVSIPTHYRVLKVDDLHRHDLRMAFSSAGVLEKEDAAYFHSKTGLHITEIYGSTETGGVATRHCLLDGDSWRPLDVVNWKILDGILRVKSAFISPTLPLDEDGFFATSDRADSEEDQRFALLGRVDDVVKIGGKRVDVAAVQTKMKQIPGVRDAVVISLAVGSGRQNELAALVVTHLDVQEVRKNMVMVSEAYAIPKRIVAVEKIPLTSAGKHDRISIERILIPPDKAELSGVRVLPDD